jgi:hypothetical protein
MLLLGKCRSTRFSNIIEFRINSNNIPEYTMVPSYWPISVIILVIHLPLISAGFPTLSIDNRNSNSTTEDRSQIKQIYPTKPNGREWFIDMDNPRSDGLFFITSDKNITKQEDEDESWRVNDTSIRINVDSPPGLQQWKNVEITGYVKIVSAINDSNIDDIEDNSDDDTAAEYELDFRARSGVHDSESPCEGTSMIGLLHADGSIGWKKEIWHTGGYSEEKSKAKVTAEPVLVRWVGWKVIIYNINNDTAVKMESYLDNLNTNYWVKASEIIDDGGWYAKSSDEEFYSANCGRPKDYIITEGGPLVTFRSDNLMWDFKNLSVREIVVPGQQVR